MSTSPVSRDTEWILQSILLTLRRLQPLCESLVSEHLLLQECLLCKTYLDLKRGALVHDARSRLTIIHKELFSCDLQRLTLLKIAH